MNLGNLIKNLEANGMAYEVTDSPIDGKIQIGIPTQNGDVYFWYEVWTHDEEITGEELVFFRHRYSRITGKSLKSVRTYMRFEDDLRERNVAKHKKCGAFDYIRRGKDGLIANGTYWIN